MEDSNPVLKEMEEEQERNWKDEFKEKWLETRLAIDGLMVDRVQRQQRAEETLARHARKLAGVEEDRPQEEQSSMGVSIGNKVFNHYEAPQKTEAPAGGSLLAKAAIAAALISAGGGAGMVANQFMSFPAAVVDTDTDTLSVIDFPD